jgi:alkane 1-monooxygenase
MTTAAPTTTDLEQAPPAPAPAASRLQVAQIWAKHLLCFVLPLTTLGFLATGPHRWWLALSFVGVVVASVIVDNRAGPEKRQPALNLPAWPFDATLWVLFALQLVIVALAARLVQEAGLLSVNALVALALVSTNSGYSAIVVAHELIHRREARYRAMGRLLLCTVMYEHFYTEHLRGHHARVGTPDDPATARFGESFEAFWRRTVPAQFRSAWRLEARRLGDERMPPWDARSLGNRVLHGVLAETALAVALFVAFGWQAGVFFLLQALGAVRLLEAVNYFEHWGLVRTDKKVRPIDSWDSESWFTLYTLVGLSRHADHHAYAARPYQELRRWEASPKLPRGYFGMVVMVLLRNRELIRLLTEELRRVRLGPFAPGREQPG